MRTAIAVVLTGVLFGLAGCYQPDLSMILVRPSAVEPPPYEGVRVEFEVENLDYRAERGGPTSADGPVTVQGFLSSDGVARDGGAAGETVIVPAGSSLAVGARLSGSYQSPADLDPSHPFLILSVVPSSSQTDHEPGNNSLAEVIAPTPPSNLAQWLLEHPWIKRNLVWEEPGGAAIDYEHWDAAMKSALQSRVDGILSGAPVAVADPPPLAMTPSGTERAVTTFALDTAQTIFLAHVARSIVSDQDLPWKARELSDAELAMLFDSRQLFRWDAARGAYFRDSLILGAATPGDPSFVYAYMQSHALIGTTRLDTVYRVLDWARGLEHFYGSSTAVNSLNTWQYAGDPPVSRVLAGTVRADDPAHETHMYTGGCWGTAGLFSLMLRTVNIPADLARHEGHASPHFVHEGLYLAHGDNPYQVHMQTGPWIPISELPLPEAGYQAWFGATTTSEERYANLDRRVCELTAKYLSRTLVRDHCLDLREGRRHRESRVYRYLKDCYSLANLEAQRLWQRLNIKAVELGYCAPGEAPLPPPFVTPVL